MFVIIRLTRHRFCINVPLFHCFGSVIGTLVSAASTNTCVFPAAAYSPQAAVQAMPQAVQDARVTFLRSIFSLFSLLAGVCMNSENCTFMYGTPTMYIDIFALAKREGHKFDSVRHGVMAGSICPPELNRQAIEDFGINMMIAYGTTENSPVITGTFPDDSFDKKVNTVRYIS